MRKNGTENRKELGNMTKLRWRGNRRAGQSERERERERLGEWGEGGGSSPPNRIIAVKAYRQAETSITANLKSAP